MKNFDKDPIELTDEETYELVKQIAEIEYSKNKTANTFQSVDDGVNNFFTYALDKDTRNKKGLKYYKSLSLAHFKNLVHMELRNQLAYQFRKIGVQKLILEADSLDRPIYRDNDSESLGDTIVDERTLNQIEEDLEIDTILSKIDNTNNDQIYIKIQHGTEEEIHPFSYRNLTKYYYNFSNSKKLNSASFKGVLYKSNNNEELKNDEIKKVIEDYKKYILNNDILGGATV